MSDLRLALWLCLCLSLFAHAPLAAQGSAPPTPTVELTPEGLVVATACAGASATTPLYVALDDGAPLPVFPAARTPARVAIVVETTPLMDAAGTPHSTRLADARTLATALLDRLPSASQVSLVTFDARTRVALPLTADAVATRLALAAITAPDGAPRALGAPGALADAVSQAEGQLRGAGGDSGAIFIFAADTPEPPPIAAEVEGIHDPAVRLSIVGLSGDPPSSALATIAASLGAAYFPYSAQASATLPALIASYGEHIGAVLGLDTLRLRVPARGLAPGLHRISVSGCGAALAASFDVPRAAPAIALLGLPILALAVGGAGYGIWRRRRPAPTAAPAPKLLGAPRRRGAALTTARRAAGPRTASRLSVVLWDGRERRVYPLTQRHCTLGRDPGCDISIASEWVSGLHARISLVGERVEITDLESTNGTMIGDQGRSLVAGVPELLPVGELVLIGPEIRLSVQLAGAPSDEETP